MDAKKILLTRLSSTKHKMLLTTCCQNCQLPSITQIHSVQSIPLFPLTWATNTTLLSTLDTWYIVCVCIDTKGLNMVSKWYQYESKISIVREKAEGTSWG